MSFGTNDGARRHSLTHQLTGVTPSGADVGVERKLRVKRAAAFGRPYCPWAVNLQSTSLHH